MKSTGILVNLARSIVLIMLLVAAAGSFVLMFRAGSQQKSVLLLVLFTGWVLAPFAALAAVVWVSHRWSVQVRTVVYVLALLVIVNSLIAYSGFWNTPGTRNAFVFLIVPFTSWIVGAAFYGIVKLMKHGMMR